MQNLLQKTTCVVSPWKAHPHSWWQNRMGQDGGVPGMHSFERIKVTQYPGGSFYELSLHWVFNEAFLKNSWILGNFKNIYL